MMSISMLDVAAIVGLNPYGETFHPTRQSANPLKVNMDKAYTSFMTNNIGQSLLPLARSIIDGQPID
ncbi:hypothetical protein A2U01_0056777, partial [Trifolium medium]|nr:hypothetical protein [Trifolium medium]